MLKRDHVTHRKRFLGFVEFNLLSSYDTEQLDSRQRVPFSFGKPLRIHKFISLFMSHGLKAGSSIFISLAFEQQTY